jgi:hypothetical protein
MATSSASCNPTQAPNRRHAARSGADHARSGNRGVLSPQFPHHPPYELRGPDSRPAAHLGARRA